MIHGTERIGERLAAPTMTKAMHAEIELLRKHLLRLRKTAARMESSPIDAVDSLVCLDDHQVTVVAALA